jgi:hypothetical protein
MLEAIGDPKAKTMVIGMGEIFYKRDALVLTALRATTATRRVANADSAVGGVASTVNFPEGQKLSVDAIDNHAEWEKDIEETQGTAPNYPLISDTDFAISKAYGMLEAEVEGDALVRTPADNQTVRNVFVIGPDKKLKLLLVYPMTTGRNFDEVLRVIDSLQLTAKHKVATPAQWQQGDDVIIAGSVDNEAAKEIWPDGWQEPKPYIRIVPQPK